MGQVGDPQQQLSQIALHDIELVGHHALLIAECPAPRLHLLGTGHVAAAAQLADLLRELVDLGANGVALGDDVARQRVEGDRPLELVEHVGLTTACQGGASRLGVGTQQTDIDHRSERLPLLSG